MTRPLLLSLADDPRFAVTDAAIHDPFDSGDQVATINSGGGIEAQTRAGRDAEFPDESWRRRVAVLPYFRQEVLDPADSDAVARRVTALFQLDS